MTSTRPRQPTGLRHWLTVRHRKNWIMLARFIVVGASGVVINLLVLMLINALGPHPEGAVAGLLGTPFHLRWYHLFSTAAFLVANLWNFQLNRSWTFRSSGHAPWWREYWPFITVGAISQGLGLAILTALMHTDSPLALSTVIFDDSSFLRTRLYWAQLIMVVLMTPVSFILNKVWTFRAIRRLETRA